MHVVLRQVVGHARQARVHVAAAQVFGRHHLAGGRLHQRRAAQENRALVLDDDGLVAHRRHVGAAGRARAHHHGDLGDALRAQVGLVVEDAAEVVAVGEHVVLVRQVGAAGVHQVDAGQAVLLRDLLRAQVLLHRHRVVGAALHRGVVADDHAVDAADAADAGDDAGAGRVAVVHAVARPSAPAPGRACPGPAASARDRAASSLPRAMCLARAVSPPPSACLGHLRVQVFHQRAHGGRVGLELGGPGVELRFKDGHVRVLASGFRAS